MYCNEFSQPINKRMKAFNPMQPFPPELQGGSVNRRESEEATSLSSQMVTMCWAGLNSQHDTPEAGAAVEYC